MGGGCLWVFALIFLQENNKMKRYGKITVALTITLILVIGSFYLGSQTTKADTVGRQGYNDLKYSYVYSLTGSAPYVRFIEKTTGQVYDDQDTTDYLSSTTTWTDTDVALTTKMTTIGGWLIPVPATLPDGIYDMLVYDVSTAAGSRSNADAISFGKHIIVQNARIVQMSDN